MKVDVEIVQSARGNALRFAERITYRVRERLSDRAWRRSAGEVSDGAARPVHDALVNLPVGDSSPGPA